MKRLLMSLEISTMMLFIVLAFFLGVLAGWQSASDSMVKERHSQTMTLRRVGE